MKKIRTASEAEQHWLTTSDG